MARDLLIFVGFLILVFGLGWFVMHVDDPPRGEKLDRKSRKAFDKQSELINKLEDLASDNRDIAPELSVMILDEIRKTKRELRA